MKTNLKASLVAGLFLSSLLIFSCQKTADLKKNDRAVDTNTFYSKASSIESASLVAGGVTLIINFIPVVQTAGIFLSVYL